MRKFVQIRLVNSEQLILKKQWKPCEYMYLFVYFHKSCLLIFVNKNIVISSVCVWLLVFFFYFGFFS